MAGEGRPRIAPLDGLRGLAVLAVILYHATYLESAATGLGRAFLGAARAGWMGVDLFFVLSGFLITGILWDSRGATNAFRVFYARRFLRIFPLYYLSLLLLVLLFRVPAGESLWYWLYASNVKLSLAGWPRAPISHFWSLAVEEQYYLVWPLVVSRLPAKGLVGVLASLVVLVPAARTAAYVLGAPEIALYVLTPCRLDGLALGSLLALAFRAAPAPGRWARAALAALFLGAAAWTGVVAHGGDAFWGRTGMLTVGFTALALVFGALVYLAASLPESSALARALSWRPLRSAGKVSYAMYVFHFPVIHALREAGFRPARIAPGAAGFAVYLGAIFAVITALALLSWRVLEGPCLALKDRIAYRWPGTNETTGRAAGRGVKW